MQATLGVVGIGNALVDVLSSCDDAFIASQTTHGMIRGAMNLIDADRALSLYDAMGPATQMSGGSAGNTMAVFASFGGKGGYIGKVGSDQLGGIFAHDLQSMGVRFSTPPCETPTGRCMILVTPDAERTMNTFLGAAVELSPEDIDAAMIADADVTYLEGYLFDRPLAMKAFYTAAEAAHAAGRKVSMTLSDPFCVERHRAAFLDFIKKNVDILFANEDEIRALYECEFDEALEKAGKDCTTAAITCGAQGSVIVHEGRMTRISAVKIEKIVDTTGAGDAYAAGFLYGYTSGKSVDDWGRLGSLAASEVISHMGPRPAQSLATLAA